MLRSYFIIAWRNLLRNKVYSCINISGLAVGLAACALLMLFVQEELSYDRFHLQAEQIYRVALESGSGDRIAKSAQTPFSMAAALENAFPEIAQTTQLVPYMSGGDVLIASGEKRFYEKEKRVLVVDRDFLEVFTFPLQRGDSRTALEKPNTAVITREMAVKYFGQEEPLGKTFHLPAVGKAFEVTGVLGEVPGNSHLQFDFLLTYDYLASFRGMGDWAKHSVHAYLYVVLQKGASAEALEGKLAGFHQGYEGAYKTDLFRPYLQPLTDIHLYSHLRNELGTNRQVKDLYLFGLIAFLILLVACINYMNLATAQHAQRAREVGVRKVLGADKGMLIRQFTGESLLFSLLALVLAAVLMELAAPLFNALWGKELSVDYRSWSTWLALIGVTGLVGILSGSYPAFFLSAFQPTRILQGKIGEGGRSGLFRKVLVVVQFVISTTFLLATLIVYSQRDFIKDRQLGYEVEQVIVIPTAGNIGNWNLSTIKSEFSKGPHVLKVSSASMLPGTELSWGISYELQSAERGSETVRLPTLFVDADFIEMMDIELVAGGNFTRDIGGDRESQFILNETALRQLGNLASPLGAWLSYGLGPSREKGSGAVVGVAEDVHFESLHHAVGPLVFCVHPPGGVKTVNHLLVKVRPGEVGGSLEFLREKWEEMEPSYPFQYSFLDQNFAKLYREEERLTHLFGTFSLLAIFVSCLGLLGLSAFMVERRTKEIGIRKVLGSTASGIVLLLSGEFIRLVLLANLFAWPLAFFTMRGWLENFAYRIDLEPELFLAGSLIILGFAWGTTLYQAVRAALANPVEALRYE